MSRITIVPDDQVVTVDGVPVWFTYSFASDVNAVQWYDTYGAIEYREMVGEVSTPTGHEAITDFSPYEYLLPLRQQAMEDQCNARPYWHWDETSNSCVSEYPSG